MRTPAITCRAYALVCHLRRRLRPFMLALGVAVGVAACAHAEVLPGTSVPDTPENRAVLDVVEKYRERLVEKNVEEILVLASPEYFEDGGTPNADDDYGYEGLRDVLIRRLSRVKAMTFDIRYLSVNITENRAEVTAALTGTFQLAGEGSDRVRRKNDYNRFVLGRDKSGKWRFLSGM